MKRIFLFFLLLVSSSIHAITWGELEVDDPVLAGEKCSVHEPRSWGSYIYGSPSKYDQVFWPLTVAHGIWFCEKSGFTAFIGDFDNLSLAEKTDIKSYLQKNYQPPVTIEIKLMLLKNIYDLRNVDREFRNRLLRVLARWHQNLNDNEQANAYRKAALEDIVKSLDETLSDEDRLEYLYLAMNYSRQFGNVTQADKYLDELESALDLVSSEELKGFAAYLKELIPDSEHIKPGGVLDPVMEK